MGAPIFVFPMYLPAVTHAVGKPQGAFGAPCGRAEATPAGPGAGLEVQLGVELGRPHTDAVHVGKAVGVVCHTEKAC